MRDAANVFVLYARVPFSLSLSLSFSRQVFFWFDDSESFAKFSAHLARKCCPITTPVPSLIIGSQALKEVLVIIINNNDNDNNAIVFFFAPPFTRRAERERERERTQSNNNNNGEKRGRKTNDSIRKRREPKWNLSLFLFLHEHTEHTHEQNKNERSETTTCALYFSSYLYFAQSFWCCA